MGLFSHQLLRIVHHRILADDVGDRGEGIEEEGVERQLAAPFGIEKIGGASGDLVILDEIAVPADAIDGIKQIERGAAQFGQHGIGNGLDLRQFLAEDLRPGIGLHEIAHAHRLHIFGAAQADKIDGASAAAGFRDHAGIRLRRALRRPFDLERKSEALVERLFQRLVRLRADLDW